VGQMILASIYFTRNFYLIWKRDIARSALCRVEEVLAEYSNGKSRGFDVAEDRVSETRRRWRDCKG